MTTDEDVVGLTCDEELVGEEAVAGTGVGDDEEISGRGRGEVDERVSPVEEM